MTTVFSIDPGIDAAGFAVFKSGRLTRADVIIIGSREKRTWSVESRIREINVNLNNAMRLERPDFIVSEMPQDFSSSAKGLAARNAGTVLNLALAVGSILELARANRANFITAPVNQWKGNLPKDVVNERIERILKKAEVDLLSRPQSHDWDAAGIGLWYLGRF